MTQQGRLFLVVGFEVALYARAAENNKALFFSTVYFSKVFCRCRELFFSPSSRELFSLSDWFEISCQNLRLFLFVTAVSSAESR